MLCPQVRFGKDTKTVYVVAVPVSEDRTIVHYKLYRNFMYVHPRDESILNKIADNFFQRVMTLTLNEDKEILESLYKDHQAGYVLSRYDKPLKLYRKAIKEFLEATKAREELAMKRSLEMDLLRLVETTERGRKASRTQHETIVKIVRELEGVFARQLSKGQNEEAPVEIEDRVEKGSWHLVYANNGEADGAQEDHVTTNAHLQDKLIEQRLRQAGGERWLLDFKARGRPLWQDTEESIQTIDTCSSSLSNVAVYRGLLGMKTTVELTGKFFKSGHNRKSIRFNTALVDMGGLKVNNIS